MKLLHQNVQRDFDDKLFLKLEMFVARISIISSRAQRAQCLKITQNVSFDHLFNFGSFNELLSTQNVNVARFARNVE